MKRYIKASFGYYDKDWVDPDETYTVEPADIEIDFENTPLFIADDYTLELEYNFEDEESYDFKEFIASESDIEEVVYDEIVKVVEDYTPGKYIVNGWVRIPYEIYLTQKRNPYGDNVQVFWRDTTSKLRVIPAV